MYHKIAFLGSPGTGKSLAALSYPGVEQCVFGASEETSALNFVGRTDILPPVKLDWYDALTDIERARFTDEKVSELDIATLTKLGRARNVARFRRYLYQVKADLLAKKRPELQSLVLDNFSPFSLEVEDYVEIVWGKDFITKDGNFDTIAYYKRFASEVTDLLRFFMSLPCHTIITCHVSMAASEEIAANVAFLQAAKMGGVKKEWQPFITGRARHVLAAIPDWCVFCKVEESPGKPTIYTCKLEADESNVGVAKPRIQPFLDPRRILFPKGRFYECFDKALTEFLATGKQVGQPT